MSKKVAWKPVVFREGSAGVVDANRFRKKCQRPKFVADCLARYQAWRKGEGEYDYSTDPEKCLPQPFCPKALSIIEDEAIRMILEHDAVKSESGHEADLIG